MEQTKAVFLLPWCQAVELSWRSTCCKHRACIILPQLSQLIFWETQDVLGFFCFLFKTHTQWKIRRNCRSSRDQTVLSPYQFGKPLHSKWFLEPQVIRLCPSPWIHLQDSEIKRASSLSKMSSNRLNSCTVIKYSSRETPVPAENGLLFYRCYSRVKIGASHWLWLKKMNEIRYKEIGMIGFYSNHDDWQRPSASEQNPASHRGYCIQL